MTRIIIIAAIYLITPVLISWAFPRWMPLQKIGTVIAAYAIGIIMALTGFVSFAAGSAEAATMSKLQSTIQSIAVPLAIPLMLFNCDFKLWTKSLPKTVAALLGGLLAVIIAIIAGFFVFRESGIDNFPNVAAMMTGIYTGGTMNFFALGSALNVDPNTITITYTFEMLITFPLIMFIVGGGYKFSRKLLPFADESVSVSENDNDRARSIVENGIENYRGMIRWATFRKTLLGLLLSVLFLAIGAGVALLTTGKLNELAVILTITTLSIIASFSRKVRELPRTFELGMIFILLFSVVVASQFDIYSIDANALNIGLFILFVMLVSLTLHILFCRASRVSGDLFTVAQVGLFCSPPFIPPVVGAMGNKKVLISGIVIGLVGYAVGTYLGVMMAELLKVL